MHISQKSSTFAPAFGDFINFCRIMFFRNISQQLFTNKNNEKFVGLRVKSEGIECPNDESRSMHEIAERDAATMAQLVEQRIRNAWVAGSSSKSVAKIYIKY